jgi:virginiamycin B lyase
MKYTDFSLRSQRTLLRGVLVGLMATLIMAPLPARENAQAASGHSIVTPMAEPMQSGATINEYSIPTPNSGSSNITTGVDGNFWFTETNGNKIGQLTIDGVFKEFPLSTSNSQPFGIASGPDTRLWFTEQGTNKIGAITIDGTITEFSIPTANSKPTGIATGSDDALWFTENTANKIGRITTSGTVTEFAIPTANSGALFIVQGPDSNMWFTENTASKIGRITPAGAISEFATPTANSGPQGITAAFDGNIWFTEKPVDKIGVATTAGSITEIPLFAGSDPARIAAATDGSVLITEQAPGKILKITPSAASSEIMPSDFHIETGFNEIVTSLGSGFTGVTSSQNSTSGITASVIAAMGTQSNKTLIFKDNNFDGKIDFEKILLFPPAGVGDIATYVIHVKNKGNPLSDCKIYDDEDLTQTYFNQKDFHHIPSAGPGTKSFSVSDSFSLGHNEELTLTIQATVKGSEFSNRVLNQARFVVDHTVYASAQVSYTVGPPKVFSATVAKPDGSVTAGQTGSFGININAEASDPQARGIAPEATNVNLSASVFPATDTITSSFSPNPATVPGSTTLNVSTTSSTPVGTYTIIITGTAGSVTHNAVVTLTVTVGSDFVLGFDQSTITVPAGTGKVPVNVNINRTGGFTGAVTVTPPPKMNGIKAKPPDPIATTDSSVTFKFKAAAASPGQYPLTFSAQDSAGRTRTATLTLVIQ